MAINPIAMKDFEEKILNEQEGILVDFWRDNCGTCQALSQELELLAEEKPELKIYSASVENEPELAKKLRVMMAPSLLFIKGGIVKKKSLGFKSKDSIIEMMGTFFND